MNKTITVEALDNRLILTIDAIKKIHTERHAERTKNINDTSERINGLRHRLGHGYCESDEDKFKDKVTLKILELHSESLQREHVQMSAQEYEIIKNLEHHAQRQRRDTMGK